MCSNGRDTRCTRVVLFENVPIWRDSRAVGVGSLLRIGMETKYGKMAEVCFNYFHDFVISCTACTVTVESRGNQLEGFVM